MVGRFIGFLAGLLAAVMFAAAPAHGATIEVTTNNDELQDGMVSNSQCSLREAVQAANTNTAVGGCPKGQAGRPDLIELQATNYVLNIPTTDDGFNQDGDLDVSGGGELKVRGQGRDSTLIETTVADRIFDIFLDSEPVTLEKLEMSGGDATTNVAGQGGNVSVLGAGKLVMRKVRSSDSFADSGGGIFMSGTTRLELDRTTVDNGRASLGGGGISLVNSARATLTRSAVTNNDALGVAFVKGAGISNGGTGALMIVDTTFSGNVAQSAGAFDAAGGAIFSEGPLSIKRSLFVVNDANALTDSRDEFGGAVVHLAGDEEPATIVNSTFAANSAPDQGGAFWTNGGPTSISHVTFSGNEAGVGDHLYSGVGGEVDVRNSILPGPVALDTCGGTASRIVSRGYNIFSLQDPECPPKPSDEIVSDAGLDPDGLQANGGFTDTIAIRKSSEARNLVPLRKCGVAEGEDQRGFKRPAGKRCDAGSFERGATRNR